MKIRNTYLILLAALLLVGCNNQLDNISSDVLPQSEMIAVGADTFHVQAENIFADYIYSRSDSFLLGNYQDDEFGNTRAEILAQFAAPEGYTYPAGATLDSVCVYLYYYSWYGYPKSSLHVQAYRMDKKTFSYSQRYPSNLDVSDYCSKSEKMGDVFVSPSKPQDSIEDSYGNYVRYITLKLSKKEAQTFFNQAVKGFSSQSEFCNWFKGIYFTTDFGTSCMLYITQIDLSAYYHYSLTYTDIDGVVHTTTNSDSKTYPANSEVRQVNLFSHGTEAERWSIIKKLNQIDSLCFVASPANIYTTLHVPTRQMLKQITTKMGSHRPYVNAALLKVDLVDVDTNAMATAPSYMLLVKRTAMDRFFDNKDDTSDTCAILGSLSYTTDSAGTTITGYYYQFDLAGYLNAQLRLLPSTPQWSYLLYDTPYKETGDDLYGLKQQSYENWQNFWKQGYTDWVLVPVEVETTTTTSSTSVTDVRHMYTMSAARLRNGKNPNRPMRVSVVYSGF